MEARSSPLSCMAVSAVLPAMIHASHARPSPRSATPCWGRAMPEPAEAELEEWFSPGTEEAKLTAAALGLARALREYSDYFDPGWSDDRPRWALFKRESDEALANWDRVLRGLNDA